MPIPFILGALAIGGTVLGAAGHAVAKETNEEAQSIARNAEKAYNRAKISLENSQELTENTLIELGCLKRDILKTSINQFIRAYDRIKHIKLEESIGINELSNLKISTKELIELQELSNQYDIAFSTSAGLAAAATSLATAGMATTGIVTTGITTTSLALGAFTPLAFVAAPMVFFTALSSSMKADENLEKAKTMRAEANLAIEKMKTSETKLKAITKRTNMLNNLLEELNVTFSYSASLMDSITLDRMSKVRGTLRSNHFTPSELRLFAAIRSLAGAVKSIIDTPILTKDGNLSTQSKNVYYSVKRDLPELRQEIMVRY